MQGERTKEYCVSEYYCTKNWQGIVLVRQVPLMTNGIEFFDTHTTMSQQCVE